MSERFSNEQNTINHIIYSFFVMIVKENYMELMEKVLNTFKPGKFLMTVFANKVRVWRIKS
jgi:hypothetical protein